VSSFEIGDILASEADDELFQRGRRGLHQGVGGIHGAETARLYGLQRLRKKDARKKDDQRTLFGLFRHQGDCRREKIKGPRSSNSEAQGAFVDEYESEAKMAENQAVINQKRVGRPLRATMFEVDQGSGYWNWSGFISKGGYGKLHRKGLPQLAHRAIYLY